MFARPLILHIKNLLYMNKFIFLLSLFAFCSCNSGTSNKQDADTIIIPREESPARHNADDCYADRATIKVVGNRTATIIESGGFVIMDCVELSERYHPCELPDWATEGVEVVFSGVTKEVKENERRAGTPFLISDIKKK